jgi:hypothetical protein
MKYDEVFLAFLECAKRGDWDVITDELDRFMRLEKSMTGWRSRSNECEVWIVRPDGVKRAFRFPPRTKVWVGNGVIKFYGFEAIQELAVDENERAGKPPAGKLEFTR